MFNTLPHCDPPFRRLLDEIGADSLDQHAGTVFGTWPDFSLAYVNPAWHRFAADNQGEPAISRDWPLGKCLLDAVPETLRPFFIEHYRRCLVESRPWEHIYECSSANTFRIFHMNVLPLGQAEGLLVINSLRVQSHHTRIASPPDDAVYRQEETGLLVQCCHCRRVQRASDEHTWDWVPDWVRENPPLTSHGLCAPCFGFYYSESRFGQEFPVSIATGFCHVPNNRTPGATNKV